MHERASSSGNSIIKERRSSICVGVTKGQVGDGPRNGKVVIWDVATGAVRLSISAQGSRSASIRTVRWNTYDDRIATAADETTGRIWKTEIEENQKPPDDPFISTLEGHEGIPGRLQLTEVEWNPSGTLVATASQDSTVRIWKSETGELVALLDGHETPISDLKWSPDGSRLASSASNYEPEGSDETFVDKTVRIWSVTAFQEKHALIGNERDMFRVLWEIKNKDGLVTVGYDQTVRLWNTTKGIELKKPEFELDEDESISDAVFSTDELAVLIGTTKGKVRRISFDPTWLPKPTRDWAVQ